MVSFRTTVHNHRIEIPASEDLPDGTEVLVQVVPMHERVGCPEGDWDDTPEGVADWLAWLDRLEPLQFTDHERAEMEVDRQARKQWEETQFDDHADHLAGHWK